MSNQPSQTTFPTQAQPTEQTAAPDQSAIVPAKANEAVALDIYGDRNAVREFAARIKLMISGGNKLADNEAMALAQFSTAAGLNPFVGEAFYMPGVGPIPGIAAYRRKADEQLDFERRQAREPFARWNVVYTEPDERELSSFGDIKPGDIVVRAVVTDTLSQNNWEQRKLGAMVKFITAGLQAADAAKAADALVGPQPVWTGVGIVRGAEDFGKDKMARYERACKRAEKPALKKRFPRINLPDGPEAVDEPEPLPAITITTPEQPKRTEAQNLADLGFK